MRTALTAALLTAVLAACGEAPEVAVEKSFRGYHAALLARDFATACSYNSPEATTKLLASLRTQAIEAASCEEAFSTIYAEEGASAAADGVGNSVQIQSITVNGDEATVSWTAELDGEQRPAKTTMRRAEDRWQLVAD
jgi:hypothetical protein